MTDSLQLRDDLLSREELREKFGLLNYLVFSAMLLLSALIGVFYCWRGNRTTEDFLLASRSMSTIPIALSMAVSFISPIAMLGTPIEIYTFGSLWLTSTLKLPFAVALVIHFFIPVYDRLRLTTSYEYLELRFNKAVKLLVSSLFCLQMVFFMTIVVYAPALALIQVTGFLNGIDFDIEITCAIIFTVCIFYSSIGGIKAVIWTDTLQAVVMFVSYLGIMIYGTLVVGGPSKVFDINYQAGRVQVFNFDPDIRQRLTTWGILISGVLMNTSLYGTNQAMVQRYSTVKNKSQVVTSLWLNSVLTFTFVTICCYAGMVVFAFYHDCDPLAAKQVSKADQIIPLFVMQLVGDIPGLPGLFVAGVFSGALSTVSSGLNSLAAVLLTDFLPLVFNVEKLSEQRKTLISKLISCGFGIISFAFVFMVKNLPGIFAASVKLFGMVGGPILGVFSLGMFVPFSSPPGALVGLLSSLAFVFWAGLGQMIARQEGTYDSERFSPEMPSTTEQCPSNWTSMTAFNTTVEANTNTSNFVHLDLYDMSYLWYGPVSLLLCLTVGCLVSLCKPEDHRLLDPRLVSPNTPTFFCWTPSFVKRKIKTYFLNVGCDARENVTKNQELLNMNIHTSES